jgi:hypothetical protein
MLSTRTVELGVEWIFIQLLLSLRKERQVFSQQSYSYLAAVHDDCYIPTGPSELSLATCVYNICFLAMPLKLLVSVVSKSSIMEMSLFFCIAGQYVSRDLI